MAAFDMDDPKSIVSPGGVGFDINCGVRLLRTNLFESDVLPVKVIIYFYNFVDYEIVIMYISVTHIIIKKNFLGATCAKHV